MDTATLGRRIAAAREYADMTQEGLGNAVGLDRTAVSRLEKGERKVSVVELVGIAASLKRPMSFFVEEPVPAAVSRRQDLAHAHASTRALDVELEQFAADVRTLTEMGLLQPVARNRGSSTPKRFEDAELAASRTRAMAGLDAISPVNLAESCERLGLYSLSLPLGAQGADGACVEVSDLPSTAGAAVLNGDAPAGRRRMTLAHELGHWIFGDAYDAEASVQSERMINAFAIHFLAPRSGVLNVWRSRSGWSTRDRALAVGAEFRLSWSAAVSQLKNLNLLSHEQHRSLTSREPRSGDYLRLGLTWVDELAPPYLSPALTSAILNAYADERLTESRALELLRGTISADELPTHETTTIEDLRGSFAGHGD